ncbi:hypothetical protein [Parashewanella tropica]|uniref:hypothetical protein n=1 Tax=Parashewanella tropica TaxID=2547970 RepID=UPI001059ABE0|nr:hypothetical protein [Parashewanella tropica]
MRILKSLFLIGLLLPTIGFAKSPQSQLVNELVQCAAYYQISSNILSDMNAPRMKGVAEKLKTQYKASMDLANKYDEHAIDKFDVAKATLLSVLPNKQNLSELMAAYKDKCPMIISDPEKRLSYWQMADM